MKHWIELHIYNSENRIMFNLNNIVDIVESNSGGTYITSVESDTDLRVQEPYEKIKEMIHNSI